MDQIWSNEKGRAWIFCLGLDPYKMARSFLSKKNVNKIFAKFAQARGGWVQPFCNAFELHCHFVVKKNHFAGWGVGPLTR